MVYKYIHIHRESTVQHCQIRHNPFLLFILLYSTLLYLHSTPSNSAILYNNTNSNAHHFVYLYCTTPYGYASHSKIRKQ